MEFDMKAAGERLLVARKAKGLKRHHVAVVLNISPETVGAWERGETAVKPQHYPRLATLLGVDSFARLYLGDE